MAVRFEAAFPASHISSGVLVYRREEYSFDVEPHQGNFTSVLFNDLNVEVNELGRATSVWGYCPYVGWRAATISPPPAEFGDLFFVSDEPLSPGVSQKPSEERWPIFFDRSSGWVFLDCGRKHEVAVKILTGVIAGIDSSGSVSGIWLKPNMLPF